MKLIYKNEEKRVIQNQEEIKFSSISSYHLIVLTARVKGEKQLEGSATDDEDLAVQIDGKNFPKLFNNNDLIDSPAAFNGGKQHNLSKTVYLLTYLQGKDHKLILNADNPPGTATFEKLEIYAFDPTDRLSLEPQIKAEDGDRRSWITFALDNIPLQDIDVTITYSRRKQDSDDVKIKIDGQTQENILRDIKNFLWYFAGLLIPLISPTRTESQTFAADFLSGLHYIELDADRTPVLEKVVLNFGSELLIPKRVPTVNDPQWTGDFYDDSEIMILARAIYGEVGGESEEAKIAVGWVIRNRVEDELGRFGKIYHRVILAKGKFEPFSDSESDTFKKITNPPLDNTEEKTAWKESYHVAEQVLTKKVADPTKGANHFYAPDPTDSSHPYWAENSKYTTQIGKTKFYRL